MVTLTQHCSVVFLLSVGLDAASSFELLSHLNQLADSNRTVILTIHQPRLEIFHMFHRLVLLCDGKVREGGREGGTEGRREGGRDGGTEGGREKWRNSKR